MSQYELKDSGRPKGGFVASTELTQDIQTIRNELDGYYKKMIEFPTMEADEIFMQLSSFTARMSYIRSAIMRSDNRLLVALRTKEIDPFINECDRQFKIWSRTFSVQTMEYETSRGQT